MDESEESKALTPLGNERRDNPGQTNIMMNSDGADLTPAAPQWDESTPLEDITSQYTGIGDKFNDLVENAADNVGDRQVQLIGNDFGATNPYMFNTYYEPAATTFASKMRMEGTQAALEEGLDRGAKEAQDRLNAAQQRYNNAVAAQRAREEQQRNANAYISETDTSKLPQGTNERDLINSVEFQNMSEADKKSALEDARIHDMQDTLTAGGVNIDWNDKNRRTNDATNPTLEEFGYTRDQYNGWSQEEKDAFWARKDVGNAWTRRYMESYYRTYYPESADMLVTSFNDIRNDVNAIVDAYIKDQNLSNVSDDKFYTAVPVPDLVLSYQGLKKSLEASEKDAAAGKATFTEEERNYLWSILNQYEDKQDEFDKNIAELQLGYRKMNEDWHSVDMTNPELEGHPVLTFFDSAKRGISNSFDEIPDTFTFNDWWNLQHLVDAFDGDKKGEQQAVTAMADELGLPSAGDLKKLDSDRLRLPTDEGAKNDEWFSFFGKGTYYPAGYTMAGAGPVSVREKEKLLPYRVDDVFESAYGVDYQSIDAIAKLKETSPEDYEYLMNQAAFIMNIKDPIEIVEDENKEYFINGEYKKLQKGDLVFHTVDGTIIGNPDDENYFYDTDAKNYIDLYRSIYNGTDAASEENLALLEKYYNQYRSNVQAAMALSGMYGVQANEDIYAAVVLVRDKSNDSGNKKLIVNPFDPNGEKITYNEFKNWWEGLGEDSRKNAYVEIAKKARQTRGHYYIAGEYGGIEDVRGGESNGVDVIGTYGKNVQQDWYATNAARAIQALSNEDCLALNIILDTKMREGDIKQNFMDNDEIPVFDQIINGIGGLVDGTAHLLEWGFDTNMAMVGSIGDQFAAGRGKSGYGVNDFSRYWANRAGKHWDEMTTIDKNDDSEFLQSIGLNDMVMGNRYTQEVRNQQRANLNHLIDTTFNIDYFDPENTYDEKTGEMRDKDGKVIALFDNHYFHTDQARALAYMGIDLLSAVAEFAIEEALTAGVGGLVHKGAEFAMKKSPALAKASVKLTTSVGKGYSMRVAAKLAQLERGRKAAQAASTASKATKKAAKEAAKAGAKGASSVDDVARVAGRTGAKAADNLIDDAAKIGAKSADNVADNIVENVAKKYTDNAAEAAGNELSKMSKELAEPLKGLGDYTLETRLTKDGEAMVNGLTAEQRTRNAVLDTVINATDEGADLTVTQKIVNKLDDILDKTFIGKANSSIKNIVNGLSSESAFTVLQRSAMNVRIAEASGVAAERVAQLSDDAAGILYGSLLRAQGGSGFVPGMGFMGRDTKLAGSALKEAGLDFKGAVEQAADQSFRLAQVGGSLSGDDTIRILAQNSKNKNALISALKRDSFIKDRLTDWAQDIRMNYYTPYLDEDFNSDYTDIKEYISDPTQWLAGAAFDASVTGTKRLSASYKLARTNAKINKIMSNIDVSPTSAVDKAKLAKQITKLNSLRVNADRLSNQMLDNHISVTKVTEVRKKATDALDKQMSRITDSFDFEKSLDFMTNNLKEAAEKTTRWDKIKDKTGFFGRSRVAQAQDLNRYLLKSNQSLEAFWTLSQAQQADAVIKFAEIKSHTRNMSEIDSQKWARSVSEGFKATQDMPVAKIFGDDADVIKNGTINIKDKEKAKELVEKGQTVLYDEIYNALARNVGDITNLPALRSELNWVRDKMVDFSKKAIDNGQKVRWNYFPTQGIMFEGISDTPMALVGFYYGSGLHPDVSNKMANPNLTRDTWDFAEISQNILDGKDHYTQQIGAVEKIQNAKKGITDTAREVPYNMDFFNPAYALQAYSNTFESKQFAAKMLDPMQNGHVVVRSDSVLDGVRTTSSSQLSTITEQRKAKLTEDFKKARAEKNKAKIEAIKKDTQDSIAKAEKSLTKKTSKDVDKANTRILKEQSRAEKKVVESDLFKGYARYSGLEGKANSTIAKQMSDDYGQVVKDIAAVRAAKGSEEVAGVSAEYRKNGIYKQNVDALAKSKTLTKDVLHQNQTIRIGGSRGADLNSNALKKPFYNTIASLQQTKKVDAAWNKFVVAMKNSDAFSEAGLKAEDFVRSYPVDTTDLRKRFSDDIYKIVSTKFGVTNDFTGNLKLNDNFRKTLNQYIGDAYDTVLGRKAAGEGIALAEVIEELNNLMPSLELAKSAKYNDFMSTLSAYQNSGGSIEDLRATILVECANLKDQGLLDTPEGRNLIGTIRILDEAAEGSERISNMSSEGKFTSIEAEEEQFGDSVFGGSEDADPEKAMMAREDEAERLAGEAPRNESLMAKVLREYSSDMDDVQRYKALKSTIEYLDKKKTKVTENMTFGQTLTYNKDGFAAFHSQVEAPYKSIAKDFQEKVAAYNQLHPKKPIKLTDADTKILNPPKKGILEGISDNQFLKLERQYNNGAESFKIGKKTYTRAELKEAMDIGTDGRGIVELYNPNKLKELIDRKSKGKKLNLDKKTIETLEKLTGEANIEFASGVHYNTYDEFKDAFTSKETRGQSSDNFVNIRTAIERNLADNKSGNAPLINLGELAITSDIENVADFDYNTININGKDGNLEITLVPDYGTRGASDAAAMFGESNNTAVGYHLDVEDGTGKHTQFANFEELSNSDLLSDDFAGDSVALKEYFEKETGNKVPQATDNNREFTQHFGKRAEEQEPLQWTPQKRTLKQDYIEYKTIEGGIENQKELFEDKYGVTPDEYRKDISDVIEEKMSQEDFRKKYGNGKQVAKDYAHIYDLNETLSAKKNAFNKKSKEYEALGIPFGGMDATVTPSTAKASEAPVAARSLNNADSEDILKFKAAQQKEFAKTDNYRVPKDYETEVDGMKMGISADRFFGTEGRVPTLDQADRGLRRVNLAGYTESGATGRAYKNFADSYGSLQESVLDFPGETSDLNMDIAESNLNTFLYGSKNGSQGHFDRMGELTTQLNNAKATADDIIDNDIADKLSSLKKLDGSSYEDIVEQLKAIKTEIDEVYANTPEIRDALKKRIDDEIAFTKKQIKNDKQGVKRYIEHDADYRNITEAAKEQANLKAGAGETMVHNINGTLVVGNGTTMPNRISLADLRTANEVVEIETKKTYNPLEKNSRRRKDKKVLKDMRSSFNDGYEIKGKISGNTQRQKEAWINDLASEVRERTGIPDLPESEIFVDKQMANLGQFYFKEGRQGWQESLYRKMSALSEFNKTIQDFHLAGGVGQYNAFTLRNALTMMWQDPVGGTKALFTNFRNAKDNTSVMKYFLDNHEKMLKYAIDSDDYSIINAFAPVISMDERLAGGGIVNGVINQVYGAKNTFREALEREGKFGAMKSVPRGLYAEIFNNPTFARWTIIAKADMQMRNYAKAEKFVNRMMQRYNLSDEDFANMEGGMGGKDEYIATLARMRTDRFWNPSEFALSGFSTKKYLTRQNNKVYKETFESLKGIPRQKSLNSIAGDFFFAVNYKLQMNAHPINGMGSMVASVFTVPRASLAVRNGNLAPMAMRFAGRGDRTQAAIMIGIAALAHVWNTTIGAPSAWEELWGEHGNKDNGTYGMAQSLLNFQDFGKFWLPNDGNGGFDPSQPAYAVDPFFSIFTLQNSAMRGVNKFMNPNQVPINWQRTVGADPISIWNGQAPIMNEEPTSFGTRLAGVADEWIGANLLAGYKAIYEVMNNSTYFGNNIWERKYLPDGTINKNYNPVRNLIASVAHILNLDAVLEGKSPLESGTNRWVKGLTIEEGRGWQIGEAGVRQDKIGTVSGSGLLQHEYATALGAIQRGDYFDALTESMELPFKSRNYAARAKTALNQEVMLALRQELHKYEKAIDGASPADKDKAYAEFANATVNIMHDWSAKYGNVLGTNDELTSSATKIAVSFLAGEYNDATSYVQNMYDHLRQELKMADGDQFLFSKEKMQQAISSGMSPEEAAATYNKHLTALKNAQIAEYEARKALIDAGINIDPDKNLFDSTDILHADFEAKKATVNKKLLTEIRGKLDSQVGEFKNYSEMKSYYESLIDEADTTKQKAKLANEYNKYVEDIIAPYLEEYGENILNSAYWDGDYVSNHLGKYLIIPADKTYKGKTPHSNYLKDEFGVGYRDGSNLPSDEETKEALARASKALSTGRRASAKAIVDNALVQFRQGRIHASNEDREKLLRLRAMLSSRSN